MAEHRRRLVLYLLGGTYVALAGWAAAWLTRLSLTTISEETR